MFFGGSKKPNIFIGGVGNTINSAGALSTYFNISASQIKGFKITGSDISARIDVPFEFVTPAFVNDTEITYFKSYENKLHYLESNNFKGCINLMEVEIEADYIDWGPIGSIFENCSKLSPSKIKLPKIEAGNRYSNTFRNIKNDGTTLDLSNTIIIDYMAAVSNNALDGLNSVSVDLRNCATINLIFSSIRGLFKGVNGTVKLWRLTSLQADPSAVTSIFGDSSMNKRIEINIAMKTANAGSPHAELLDAISKGATVIYTDNIGNVIE